MDITLCVMLPPRGATDWSQSAHSKMPVLNIVDVFPLQTIPEVTAPRTGYIHISGVPDVMGFDRLKDILTSAQFDPNTRELVRKRAWAADPSLLPPQKRIELLTLRQTTLTWQQARAAWKHAATGATLQQIVSG